MPLLSAEDEGLLVRLASGDVRPEYLQAPFTVQRFESVAAEHAQRVALQFEGQEMTYAEVGAWCGGVR